MRRREFIAVLSGGALLPISARAQQPVAPLQKVGFLYPGFSSAAATRIDAFSQGLRMGGFRVPEQVEIIPRFAEGDPTRFMALATDLIGSNVDLVCAASAPTANAMRAITTMTPIVALDLETDPVATGMIASLARPGGNLTGFFFDFPDFRTKLLELLREVVPNFSTVSVLWDPNSGPAQLKSLEAGAAAMKLKLQKYDASNTAELDQAIEAAKRANADALVILSSPFIGQNANLLASLTQRHALAAVTLFSEFARNGGLLSYGPNILDIYRRVGGIAAKVLQGHRPAELPVELPTKFELIVNLRTARALKLEIPPSLLVRADEVIE